MEICERTGLTPEDCLAIAHLLEPRGKRDEALAWLERGLEIDKKEGRGLKNLELERMRRAVLERLGRPVRLSTAPGPSSASTRTSSRTRS